MNMSQIPTPPTPSPSSPMTTSWKVDLKEQSDEAIGRKVSSRQTCPLLPMMMMTEKATEGENGTRSGVVHMRQSFRFSLFLQSYE
ncbi:hypothetical protein BLOT_004176 [Blomia tropicalis]|nr:hypothetical protein BLOT_004176 [Blomia tropicalis]